jgi:short-subunit dehydrogenase
MATANDNQTSWIRGKTCMITGATSGIGRASALELGKMGAKLILVCRNRERGEELVGEIQRAGNSEVELMSWRPIFSRLRNRCTS